MKLSRIQITGFKSFRNTTQIYFEDGITGVVGPNGCGKSNIVDAILWASGNAIPSRLRGEQMEDVIFSGSLNHPPASFAEVSVTLEKDEGEWPEDFKSLSELTFTRRLQRKGESRCFINNEVCLLRDIQELLMDTGAMGFSIIEQDTISQLVSAKPEQVRAFIEQTAGISKFKNKKRLAKNKLKTSCQNMERLFDILSEQKKQLKRLERQAKEAEKYRDLKDQVSQIEVSHLKNRFYNIEDQINKYKTKVSEISEEEAQCKNEIKDLSEQKKKCQSTSEGFYSKIDSQRALLKNQLIKINQCQMRLGELKTLIKLKNQKQDSTLLDFEAEKTRKMQGISVLNGKSEKAKNQIKDLEKNLEFSKGALEKTKLQLDLFLKSHRELKLQSNQIYKDKTRTEEALKNIDKDMERSNHYCFEAKNRLKERVSYHQSLKKQYTQAQKDSSSHKKQYLNLKEETRCVRENLEALDVESCKKQLDEIDKTLIQKESRRKSFELLKEKAESQVKSFQSLKKEKSFKPFLDLLEVEPSFERAASSVLGSLLYGFVAENVDQAEKALSYLKEKSLGSALFILKNNEQKLFTEKKLSQIGEPLKNKIRIKGEGQNSLDFLFESIFVVDSLSQAEKQASEIFSSKKPQALTFVTKQGDVLEYGRFVKGGNFIDEESNLLLQKKEIEKISSEIKSLSEKKNSLETDYLDKNKKYKKLSSDLEQLENRQRQQDKHLYSLNKEEESLQKELSLSEKDLNNINKQVKTFECETEEILSLKSHLEKDYKELKKKEVLSEELFSKEEKNLEQCKNKKDQLKADIDSSRLTVLSLKKDLDGYQEQISVLKNSLQEMNQKEKKFSRESQQSQVLAKEYQEEFFQLEKELSSKKAEYEKEEGVEIRLEKDQKEQSLKAHELEKSISDLASRLDQLLEDKHQLELNLESLFSEQKNLEQKAYENYQINIRQGGAEESSVVKEDATKLEQLKSQLSKIGQVNLLALSEYSELEKEYKTLQSQYDDLEKSKKELEQVIQEMDDASSKKFKKAYDEANSRFSQVFSAVFGGGEAKLSLVKGDTNLEDVEEESSEENVLGVEILASPPGKKLKNLKLLSGGEKSLTALSIIFALFLVRPAPFCLLDEVDAALDDINVLRFNALLQEISRKCQVILITHNKHSMKTAGRLYGVTMEEKGITHLLSVDMKQALSKSEKPAFTS